ncbi:MAG: hypothetical protein E2P02_19465 [Acidobacteria bacterium]|nr:MAG: hypothetical protein E2P02_19465 [Acidobacteriota bacterium]
MQSKSSDDGSMNLKVTFEIGTDIDMATVLVQNRVAIADPGSNLKKRRVRALPRQRIEKHRPTAVRCY